MSPCAMCAAADCVELRAHALDPCPIYTRLRDALFPAGNDLEAKAAHALFWLVRELGKLEKRERSRLTGDLVALFGFSHSIAAATTRAQVVQGIDNAWLVRCEDSEPWPDSEPDLAADDPHDATAKHLFDLLRAAAERAEPEESEAH